MGCNYRNDVGPRGKVSFVCVRHLSFLVVDNVWFSDYLLHCQLRMFTYCRLKHVLW